MMAYEGHHFRIQITVAENTRRVVTRLRRGSGQSHHLHCVNIGSHSGPSAYTQILSSANLILSEDVDYSVANVDAHR